jgi:hypothetical protein
MKTDEDFKIEDLLGRPLWQLSCQEYLTLMRYLLTAYGSISSESAPPRQAIGMKALADALGCSTSLLYGIRHNTDFEEAVISRIGKKEVYDVETARKIANDYMKRAREERLRGAYGGA